MAKQLLLLCLFISFTFLTLAQLTPLVPDTIYTVKPCTSRAFQWNIQAPSAHFYFSLKLEAKTTDVGSKLNAYVTRIAPVANEITQNLKSCPTDHCTVEALDTLSCKIDRACNVSAGAWYVLVDSISSIPLDFQFSYEIIKLDNPKPIKVGKDIEEDYDINGKVSRFANLSNLLERYDFFEFTNVPIKPLIEGTRILVEASVHDLPDPPPQDPGVRLFLNYGNDVAFPEYGCQVLSGIDSVAINPCYYAQGGKWKLTVQRLMENTTYDVKVFVDSPTVRDIKSNEKLYDKLLKVDDTIYYRLSDLINTDLSSTVLFAVIDNVIGGKLELAVNYQYLPFGDCTDSKQCRSSAGCNIRYAPCELKGKTAFAWYLGVKVISIDDPNKPISFTVSTDISSIRVGSLTPGIPHNDRINHGRYQHYTMLKPSGDQWFELYAYIDSTLQTFQTPVDALIFINDGPYAGSGGCYNYIDTCQLKVDNRDVYACSIQLDPCELNRYNGDVLYISIWVIDTNDYFWFQEKLSFTIETSVYNPGVDQPYLLYNGYVVTDVVAENEYAVYRIPPPISGSLSILVSHVPDDERDPPPMRTDKCNAIVDFAECIRNPACGICNGVCQSCGYSCNNALQGCSKKRDLQQQTELTMYIFSGASVLGPSCPCWKYQFASSVPHGGSLPYTLNDCQITGLENGLFVVVQGNTTAENNKYQYIRNRFVLSVQVLNAGAKTTPTSIFQNVLNYEYINSFPDYYLLQFDRVNLLNKVLVITTQAHTFTEAETQLAVSTNPLDISCGQIDAYVTRTCKVDSTNPHEKGHCTITLQPCQIFSSDSDSRYFYVVVRSNRNDIPPRNQYSIKFELLDIVPVPLFIGSPIDDPGYLRRDVYSHYYIDVPAEWKGHNNLLISAYYDSGHTYADDTEITMYVNTPSRPRLAGLEDDCLCAQKAVTHKYKSNYVIDACSLEAGRYYISVLTRQPLYENFLQRYTIVSELRPVDISAPKFIYNFPLDFSLYINQRAVFKFDVPESMLTDPTDVQKIIKYSLSTLRTGDQVSAYITSTNPNTCSCDIVPTYPCSTSNADRPYCERTIEYCQIGKAGPLYLSVTATAAADPLNPVPFTVFLTKDNMPVDVFPLTAISGCTESKLVLHDDKVPTLNFRHYKLLQSVGEINIEVHIYNVTDGVVTTRIGTNSLATPTCNLGGQAQPCLPDQKCVLTYPCAERVDFISVYGQSTNKNNPVKYTIATCISPLTQILLGGPALTAQKLETSASKVFTFSMKPHPKGAATIVSLKNTINANAQVEVYQATCVGCVYFTKVTFTCSSTDCAHVILECQLPPNYDRTNWYVKVTQNGVDELTYDIQLSSAVLPPAETIATNQMKTVNVAPLQFKVVSWTIAASEVVDPIDSGIQNARMTAISSDSNGSPVVLSFGVGSATSCPTDTALQLRTYGIGSCCVTAGTYFITLFNNDLATTAAFDIETILDKETVNKKITWDEATQSVTTTVDAAAYDVARSDKALPALLYEVLVSYPGIFDFTEAADTFVMVRATQLNGDAASSSFFRSSNKLAGNPAKSCYFRDVPEVSPFVDTTFQIYGCESAPVFPTDYWFAFQNTNPSQSAQFQLTVKNVAPTKINFLSSHAASITDAGLKEPTVISQYFFDLTPVASNQRQYRISISGSSVNVRYYININAPAGPQSQGCLSNLGGNSAGTVNVGETVDIDYSSCAFSRGRYYIGIAPETKDDDNPLTYTISSSIVSASNGSVFALGSTLTAQNIQPTETLLYTVSTPATFTGDLSYLRIKLDQIYATPTFKWNLDGNCQQRDTTSCVNRNLKCSSIIFPCELRKASSYVFEMSALANYTAEGWNMKSEIVSTPIVPLSVGLNSATTKSISVDELVVFKLPLSEDSFLPGHQVQIVISNVECGTIEAWLNRRYTAGPNCMAPGSTHCTQFPCTLFSFQTCNMLQNDLTADWYITVRGIDQFSSDIPIKFQVNTVLTSNVTVKNIHTNERHTVYAKPRLVSINPCTPISNVLFPQQCCPAPDPTGSYIYEVENIHFAYPIEGADFAENHNTISLELAPSINFATMYITSEAPRYCAGKPPTNQGGETYYSKSCTATTASGGWCTINLNDLDNGCSISNRRQLFITVEPSSVVPLVTGTSNEKRPVAYITNRRDPHSTTDILFSETTQYFKFTLKPYEKQYFRINHAQQNREDYRFRAAIINSRNGFATLTEGFNACYNPFCVEPKICSSVVSATSCSRTLPDCTCVSEHIPCSGPKTYTSNTYSYLTLSARPNLSNDTVMWGHIQFDFIVPIIPIPPTCETLKAGQHIHYKHLLTPSAEQVWYFELRKQSAGGSPVLLLTDEDRVPLSNTPCSIKKDCSSSDAGGCGYYYRKDGIPYLSAYSASDAFYLISARLVDVNVVPLSNGIPHIGSTSYLSDTCLVSNNTYYHKYTVPADHNYMLVQYTGPGSLYIHPNHVTVEHGWLSCIGSCIRLIACNLMKTPNTYYFHIPTAGHTITVTSGISAPVPLNLGTVAKHTLKKSGEFIVYSLNVPNSNSVNPTNDLDISYNVGSGVSKWVNRGTWGDSSCLTTTNPKSLYQILPECAIHKTTEKLFITFFLQSEADCQPTSTYLRVDLRTKYEPQVTTTPANTAKSSVIPGLTTRVPFTFPSVLTEEEVLYVRLPKVDHGEVSHIVRKGNYIPTEFACSYACSEGPQYTLTSWHDHCFHCSSYSDFFVDVQGQTAILQQATADFEVSATKETWKPIGAVPTSAELSTVLGTGRSIHFYTVSVAKPTSYLIQVEVTSGIGVEVQIYPKTCSLRGSNYKVWCFPGEECQFPLERRSNYGSFATNLAARTADSMFLDSNYRIIVSGRDSTYTIKALADSSACSTIAASNAPFCSSFGQSGRLAWGTSTTFPEKDEQASRLYDELYLAFSCKKKSGCACVALSQECIDNLHAYACQTTLPACGPNGNMQEPTYSLCQAVELTCAASFEVVGYPQLDCRHNYYTDGVAFVKSPEDDSPAGLVTTPEEPTNLLGLWIFLGILGLIIIVVAVVYFIKSRPESAGGSPNPNPNPNPYVIL